MVEVKKQFIIDRFYIFLIKKAIKIIGKSIVDTGSGIPSNISLLKANQAQTFIPEPAMLEVENVKVPFVFGL